MLQCPRRHRPRLLLPPRPRRRPPLHPHLSPRRRLLSAAVADGMAGTRHDSNQELIGQGVANILSPLFGGKVTSDEIGLPVTASGLVLPCGASAVWRR